MFTLIFLMMMLYSMAGGAVGKQVHALGQSRCKGHKGEHDWEHCGHYYTGILAGSFWPVALPLALGMKSSEIVPTPISKEIKADRKREDELKQIKHEAQVAQAEVMKAEMEDKQLELGVRRMELEGKRLELTAKGVADFEDGERADPFQKSRW